MAVVDDRHEYEALVGITDPVNPGRFAYTPGQGVHAQVVADWGLTVGEHVMALRPDEMAEPAGNASRDEWARYRLARQELDAETVDGMGRDQLRDYKPPAKAKATKAAGKPTAESGE